MNEDKYKIRIGGKKITKSHGKWHSYYVKPTGKKVKRLFNKKVRKGGIYKRGNWLELS